MKRRGFNGAALATIAAAVYPGMAAAESWPTRPITVVVGFAAGGGVDFVMRTVTPELSKRLGQSIVIDNKPGASAMLAANQVARAHGDGYTLFGTDGGAMVLNSVLFSKVTYDAVKDFAPITQLIRVPLLVVAHPSFPATDLKSLIALSKKQPLNYASVGKGTYHHLAMEQLKKLAGFEAQDIAYKGAGPAAQDVIAGQVPFMVLDTIVALPNIQAGRLKPIASLSASRLPALPNVPTVSESGVAGAEAHAWIGMAAPRSVPVEIVAKLQQETRAVLEMPSIRKRITDMGMEPVGSSPQEFAAAINADIARYHPLVQSLGMRLD